MIKLYEQGHALHFAAPLFVRLSTWPRRRSRTLSCLYPFLLLFLLTLLLKPLRLRSSLLINITHNRRTLFLPRKLLYLHLGHLMCCVHCFPGRSFTEFLSTFTRP